MNLAQFRALVAVVDNGGFTAAAAVLNVTQSAVSHAVRSFERELGIQLVARGPGGVTLTAYGDRIFAHAREAVRRADRIVDEAAHLRGQDAGRLRVAGSPSAGRLLPSLIAIFVRRFPSVEVLLLEGSDAEVLAWLNDGVADLGVVAELDSDEPGCGEAAAVLAVDRMVAIVERDHPLAGEGSVTLAELADDSFLMSTGGCEPLLRSLYERAGLDLTPSRRVQDMATLLALVAEGFGVTVVPELSLTDTTRVARLQLTPHARRVLSLVPGRPDDIPSAAQAFLDIAACAWAAEGAVAG